MLIRLTKPYTGLWRLLSSPAISKKEASAPVGRGNPSYLYVAGSKLPFSVEPDLDYRHRLSDLTALKHLLEARGYDIASWFGDLRSLSEKYEQWYEVATRFVHTYTKERLKEFVNKIDNEEYKTYVDAAINLDRLEREVILPCLRLPADLHPWTPIGEKEERLSIFVRGRRTDGGLLDLPVDQNSSHMEILHSTNRKRPLIDFKEDPPQCFLLGSPALLLRALEAFFAKSLSDAKYRRLSPAHFARSSMVEAYFGHSEDAESNHRFLLVESIYGEKGQDTTWALNLAGHGPLPYLALFTRKALGRNNEFPLKFFSHGAAYSGKYDTQSAPSQSWNLFNFPIQRPRITLWLVFEKEDELEISNQVKMEIQDLLSKLQLSFTIDQQPSRRLLMSEMSRLDFVALSMNKSTPMVPLASISNHGDFLARRVRLMSRAEVDPKTGRREKLENEYPKCCYAEIDLFNVLARLYEELCPKSESQSGHTSEDTTWWPSVLYSGQKS